MVLALAVVRVLDTMTCMALCIQVAGSFRMGGHAAFLSILCNLSVQDQAEHLVL